MAVVSVRNNNLKYKFWCFTSFDENEPTYDPIKMEYMVYVYGIETCPTTRSRHFQGFVCYKQRQRFSDVSKMVSSGHVEKCKGSFDQNVVYCKKSDNFKEFGKPPTSVGYSSKFHESMISAEKGEYDTIKNICPGLYLRYKTTLASLFKRDLRT